MAECMIQVYHPVYAMTGDHAPALLLQQSVRTAFLTGPATAVPSMLTEIPLLPLGRTTLGRICSAQQACFARAASAVSSEFCLSVGSKGGKESAREESTLYFHRVRTTVPGVCAGCSPMDVYDRPIVVHGP